MIDTYRNTYHRTILSPMWLHGIMKKEMKLLNELMNGAEVPEEFKPLLDGTAAMNSIATADALTVSLNEDKISKTRRNYT